MESSLGMEVVRTEERTGHSMRGGERGEREAGAEQSGTIGHVKRAGRLEKDSSWPATCAQVTHGDTAMPRGCTCRGAVT